MVLTFNRKQWSDNWDAFKGALRCWAKLRKRMTRTYGRIEYVQTWEQHQDGWPHVNILLHNVALGVASAGDGWKAVRKNWLEPNAIASGFGMRTWIEPMRDAEAMAGYMTKLASKLAAEVTDADVKDQVPVAAPPHFRRLRASRGLLPPPRKSGRYTGELVAMKKGKVEAMMKRQQRDARDPRNIFEEHILEAEREWDALPFKTGDEWKPRVSDRYRSRLEFWFDYERDMKRLAREVQGSM